MSGGEDTQIYNEAVKYAAGEGEKPAGVLDYISRGTKGLGAFESVCRKIESVILGD